MEKELEQAGHVGIVLNILKWLRKGLFAGALDPDNEIIRHTYQTAIELMYSWPKKAINGDQLSNAFVQLNAIVTYRLLDVHADDGTVEENHARLLDVLGHLCQKDFLDKVCTSHPFLDQLANITDTLKDYLRRDILARSDIGLVLPAIERMLAAFNQDLVAWPAPSKIATSAHQPRHPDLAEERAEFDEKSSEVANENDVEDNAMSGVEHEYLQ